MGVRKYRSVRVPGGERYVHRVVMERHLKRPLRSDEHVHHRNGAPPSTPGSTGSRGERRGGLREPARAAAASTTNGRAAATIANRGTHDGVRKGRRMSLRTKQPKTWLCPRCSHRNEATRSRKCGGCAELSRPKKRVPKHAQTLRDDSYDVYALVSQEIHGGDNEACAVCGKPKPENRRHDRDHDHRTGKPRGLACVRCNRELLRHSTLEEARKVVAYLERVEAHYAKGDEG